jgi:hypothetical protein
MGSPGRGAETAPEHEAETSRRVAVVGDVTMDWNLTRTRKLLDGGTAWNAEDRTETYGGPGGAAVLARLVEEVGATLADEGLTVQVAGPPMLQGPLSSGDPRFHHGQPRRAGPGWHRRVRGSRASPRPADRLGPRRQPEVGDDGAHVARGGAGQRHVREPPAVNLFAP